LEKEGISKMMLEHAEIGENTPLKERYVNMSNTLVRAAQSLNLAEKRVMSCAIAKLDSKRVPNQSEALKIKLSAMEYAETFGVDKDTAYDQLKSASENLFNRYVRIILPGGKKGKIEKKFRWVGGITYHDGEGWIELAFWHEIVPNLMMLRREFTGYKLAQASALRSVYSWRLLELLAQFKNTGFVRMSIEEFSHAMDVPDSYLKDFKSIRCRVIEPSVLELSKKNELLIEWTPIKEGGRRITGVEFRFRPNPQAPLFENS
jgi:plasmid replication initiation protein